MATLVRLLRDRSKRLPGRWKRRSGSVVTLELAVSCPCHLRVCVCKAPVPKGICQQRSDSRGRAAIMQTYANACQRSYAWWWKPGLITLVYLYSSQHPAKLGTSMPLLTLCFELSLDMQSWVVMWLGTLICNVFNNIAHVISFHPLPSGWFQKCVCVYLYMYISIDLYIYLILYIYCVYNMYCIYI